MHRHHVTGDGRRNRPAGDVEQRAVRAQREGSGDGGHAGERGIPSGDPGLRVPRHDLPVVEQRARGLPIADGNVHRALHLRRRDERSRLAAAPSDHGAVVFQSEAPGRGGPFAPCPHCHHPTETGGNVQLPVRVIAPAGERAVRAQGDGEIPRRREGAGIRQARRHRPLALQIVGPKGGHGAVGFQCRTVLRARHNRDHAGQSLRHAEIREETRGGKRDGAIRLHERDPAVLLAARDMAARRHALPCAARGAAFQHRARRRLTRPDGERRLPVRLRAVAGNGRQNPRAGGQRAQVRIGQGAGDEERDRARGHAVLRGHRQREGVQTWRQRDGVCRARRHQRAIDAHRGGAVVRRGTEDQRSARRRQVHAVGGDGGRERRRECAKVQAERAEVRVRRARHGQRVGARGAILGGDADLHTVGPNIERHGGHGGKIPRHEARRRTRRRQAHPRGPDDRRGSAPPQHEAGPGTGDL